MLADVPDPESATVTARISLTDSDGMPLCARVRAPAPEWS